MLRDVEKTIGNMIDKSKICMLSYIDENNFPISKAMLSPRERVGIKEIWFSTNTSSNKVKCYKENPKASIYIVDQRFYRGISLVGTIEVLEDMENKKSYGEQEILCIILKELQIQIIVY